MNVYFGSNHMQTLCDLKTLAEKHNCFIHFGVYQENTVDVTLEDFEGSTQEIIEELQNKGSFSNGCHDVTDMWFELFDATNKTYHTLSYYQGIESIEYALDILEDLSYEADSFLENNLVDWQSMTDDTLLISRNLDETRVTGFPEQERPYVYREGMALKYFGDLVCDYLKEPRIARVY